MNDSNTSVIEMVDVYLNYKINRYKNKVHSTIKKYKGDLVCESDILNDDFL